MLSEERKVAQRHGRKTQSGRAGLAGISCLTGLLSVCGTLKSEPARGSPFCVSVDSEHRNLPSLKPKCPQTHEAERGRKPPAEAGSSSPIRISVLYDSRSVGDFVVKTPKNSLFCRSIFYLEKTLTPFPFYSPIKNPELLILGRSQSTTKVKCPACHL